MSTPTARQAVKAELAHYEERIAALEAKAAPLRAALEALSSSNQSKKRIHRRPQQPISEQRERAFNLLREHPDITFTRAQLMEKLDIPSSTLSHVMRELRDKGHVRQIGRDGRGSKISYRYRPTTVRPGEGVVS